MKVTEKQLINKIAFVFTFNVELNNIKRVSQKDKSQIELVNKARLILGYSYKTTFGDILHSLQRFQKKVGGAIRHIEKFEIEREELYLEISDMETRLEKLKKKAKL